jgi:fatty-acyl-CoA synthase
VLEFYASTEGNVWLYNVEGKVGAIGRLPPYLLAREPIALARFDPEAQAPARGADGFYERCADGEIGEALGRIGADPAARFEGYSEAAETAKKILRDVFAPGYAWMRTGDLMRRDAEGFYAFVDRIGDTFRWKGENVATLEVASALAACPGVGEAIVYGVAVPGADGRAGMALLRQAGSLDLEHVARALEVLPRWARPAVPAPRRSHRDDGNLQAEAASLCRAGLRSRFGERSAVRPRRRPLCPARRRPLGGDPEQDDAVLNRGCRRGRRLSATALVQLGRRLEKGALYDGRAQRAIQAFCKLFQI